MKNIFFLLFSIVWTQVISQNLVLDENFDGTQLDNNLWKTNPPWGHATGPLDDALEYFSTSENIEVSDGTLKLKLYWHPANYNFSTSNTPANKFVNYSSGLIWSTPTFSYGTYEIRCRIPDNCLASFWLYGDHCAEEIDVFEFFTSGGCDHSAQRMNIHKEEICGDGCNQGNDDSYSGPSFNDGYHIFTCVWSPNEIIWFTDGVFIRRCNSSGLHACLKGQISDLYPVDPMHIFVTLSTVTLGSPCGPANPTIFEVDYVKYWSPQPFACDYSNNFLCCANSTTNISSGDNLETNSVSGYISTHNNIIIKNGANSFWHASQYIDLNDGFETEYGANFYADVFPCIPDGSPSTQNIDLPTICTSSSRQGSHDSTTSDLASVDDKKSAFEIYPNPSTGKFILSSTLAISRVEIMNSVGEIVFSENGMKKNEYFFDLSDRPKGIYFLKLIDYTGAVKVKKLIVE